jgi:hypothetical protein
VRHQPALGSHPRVQRRAGIGCQDVERRRREAILYRPVNGSRKHVGVVSVEPEDEAPIDHDSEIVEPSDHLLVAAAEILPLVGVLQASRRKAFEADEQAPQSCRRGVFDQVAPARGSARRGGGQHGVHRCRALKDAAHAPHAAEQIACEAHMSEQVIVEEIQMAPRQAIDLRQRIVHPLRIEAASA